LIMGRDVNLRGFHWPNLEMIYQLARCEFGWGDANCKSAGDSVYC
jgi:hypothetical protein